MPTAAKATAPRAVLGVRVVEAAPVRRGGARGRLRRRARPGTTSTTRLRCCSATTLRWDVDVPRPAAAGACPPGAGSRRKVKPLVRLTERETAAWCVVRGIDYQVDECPLAAGNRHLEHKAVLNELEARSPGAKAAFYLSFLDNMAPLLAGARAAVVDVAVAVQRRCGAPTTGETCARSAASSRWPRRTSRCRSRCSARRRRGGARG